MQKIVQRWSCLSFADKSEKGIIPTQKTYDDLLTNPIEQSFKFDLTSNEEIIT